MVNSKKHLLTFAALLLFSLPIFCQPKPIELGSGVSMKISGFVRNDLLFDSRKIEGSVDGLYHYFPKGKELDANGEDINAAPTLSLYALTSRFSTFFSGPELLNAKATAAIEFDFTGLSGSSTSSASRLRHAWVNLNWGKSDFTVGRTWHPLTLACMPTTIALLTGSPFAAFNRCEQMRFNQNLYGSWWISFTGLFRHNEAMRQSVLPELNAQLAYRGKGISFGGSVNYQNFRPKTKVDFKGQTFKTDERVSGLSGHAFVSFQKDKLVVKASSIYGQMLGDLMMGSYAVYNVNPETGVEKYTPSNHINGWVNVLYGSKFQVGLFAGYLKNLGYSKDPLALGVGRGADIADAYRIAPSFIYDYQRFRVALEAEYTAASYGKPDFMDRGKIVDTYTVGNMRLNVAMVFFF